MSAYITVEYMLKRLPAHLVLVNTQPMWSNPVWHVVHMDEKGDLQEPHEYTPGKCPACGAEWVERDNYIHPTCQCTVLN